MTPALTSCWSPGPKRQRGTWDSLWVQMSNSYLTYGNFWKYFVNPEKDIVKDKNRGIVKECGFKTSSL